MSSTEVEGKVSGVRFKCIYRCKQTRIALREPATPTGSLRPCQEQPGDADPSHPSAVRKDSPLGIKRWPTAEHVQEQK